MPTFIKIAFIMVALLVTASVFAENSVKASNGITYEFEPEHSPPVGVVWLRKNERIYVTLGKCTVVQSSLFYSTRKCGGIEQVWEERGNIERMIREPSEKTWPRPETISPLLALTSVFALVVCIRLGWKQILPGLTIFTSLCGAATGLCYAAFMRQEVDQIVLATFVPIILGMAVNLTGTFKPRIWSYLIGTAFGLLMVAALYLVV